MSKITDFYEGIGKDCEDRSLWYILGQNDSYLEFSHDLIQWLFPLKESSNFNPDAPIITDEDVQLFHSNPKLQENLRHALARFKLFLGMNDGNFNRSIFEFPNHNWLRITRCLKSLKLLGLGKEADEFFRELTKIHQQGYVSENSYSYWVEAVK